ncbi:MAG TPA: HlyD family secretion protein [Rhodopila sp.]|uniref:HlyD family secretion protein n=1 Tax=Rhodopila sp. TaxID=2480087 RepID=UPI002B514BC8|nr:HlyD family secretion protein [Rhodopila sp.]HVY15512.1 HlyD family secretion protein [Rhodopila sp.]
MSQAIAGSRVSDTITDRPVRRRMRLSALLRPLLMLGGIVAVIAVAGYWWLTGGRIVSIDDAYVRAAKEVLSTDVSGIVAQVPVHEGQHVKKGDVLLRLDPLPFKLALDGAIAYRDGLLSDLDAEKLDYQRMLRDVQVKQAIVDADQAKFDRYAALVKSGGITKLDYDDARFKLLEDQRQVEAMKTQAAVALTKLGGDPNIDSHKQNDYLQAVAKVRELQRQLDHTVIYAPFSGIVTQVDTVQPGMYLAAATAAFGLVSDDNVWVEANPKETELTYVRPGNPVEISVDTYPGLTLKGEVQSIAPNSGSEFSVLPAQNTSGNWVKVVQRIPVRIKVFRKDGDPPLRAGMSVIADIDTGHKRSWRDLF